MENKTTTGTNRTGLHMSPTDAKAMQEVSEVTIPTSEGDATALASIRGPYLEEADGLGSVPPPGTLRGAVSTTVTALTGQRGTVLIDKLGERLAFERGGVRLYDAFVQKLELWFDGAAGDPPGHWPQMEQVLRFRSEELQHAHLVAAAMEKLGADPTAQTPAANLTGVESSGLVKAMSDPRATLSQSLHVLLLAEVVDGEGWESLILLAEQEGQKDIAADFRRAATQEEEHAVAVRTWYQEAVRHDATLLADA